MGAPYPPIPNVIACFMQGTIQGEKWENVLHFGYSGPVPSQASCTTFANSLAINWSTHVSPLQQNTVIQTTTVVVDIGSTTGAEGVAANSTPGSRGTAEVPANAAVLISYPSPTRYRGGHYRTYLLAGISTDLQNQMTWSSAFQSLVNTSWQAFLSATIGVSAGGTQITQLVGLRRHGKYLPNAGPPNYVLTTGLSYPLSATSIVVQQQVASQKGRIGRRSK